jgi:hypothetical protein
LAKVAAQLRMAHFRKFEVCASYEHLWQNRHLRQAANREQKPVSDTKRIKNTSNQTLFRINKNKFVFIWNEYK